jgi:ribosomal protein S18 acetylase RimI-like enzyme
MEKMMCVQADVSQIKALESFARSFGHVTEDDYFIRQFEYQAEGQRVVIIAQSETGLRGYCIYNRVPKYSLFKKMGFPEIQDLVVHPDFRRAGIAKALIAQAEALAKQERYEYVGIGVGVGPAFGVAQQLYVRLGYVPDGNGVSYDRAPVAQGEFRPVDNELCLMMIKAL